MSKTINIPASVGSPTVTVWLNDKKYVLETGKDITVDDAVAAIFTSKKDEPAPKYNSSENYRVKLVKNGTSVTCDTKYADVFSKAQTGANVLAEYDDGTYTYLMPLAFINRSSGALTFTCVYGTKLALINFYNNEYCSCEYYVLSAA